MVKNFVGILHISSCALVLYGLAADSNSLKEPLLRHIFLKTPPSLLMRFHGVSNSTICEEI